MDYQAPVGEWHSRPALSVWLCHLRRYVKVSDEELIAIVAESWSIAECLRRMKLVPRGGNYGTLKRRIQALSLSTEHFTGQASNVNLRFNTPNAPRPLTELLVADRFCSSSHLRERLIREGVKEARCEKCGLDQWLGLPISLELDHIDGNRGNNQLENLAILCPNCHAQTSTYRGRNIKPL